MFAVPMLVIGTEPEPEPEPSAAGLASPASGPVAPEDERHGHDPNAAQGCLGADASRPQRRRAPDAGADARGDLRRSNHVDGGQRPWREPETEPGSEPLYMDRALPAGSRARILGALLASGRRPPSR